MNSHESKRFSEKHHEAEPVSRIKDEILTHVKDNEIPCAVAFEIAKKLNIMPIEVGKALDLMALKITKCQLGLFGYKPEKRKITPLNDVSAELRKSIEDDLVNNRLPCEKAWEIASRLNIRKMNVSGACETINVKIKPCQLGAF